MQPHNLPMTVMGAGLLWFGWFGFNAGSALGANGLAASAFLATNTAAAAAARGWMFTEWMTGGKPTVLGAASGAVAGLVAITPCAGYVGGLSPLVIGALTGMGMILQGAGLDKSALEIFKKALGIYPLEPNIQKLVEKLAREVEGQDI